MKLRNPDRLVWFFLVLWVLLSLSCLCVGLSHAQIGGSL